MLRRICLTLSPLALLMCGASLAEPIGEVSTAFKIVGPNHKVVVEAYDDPRLEGVTCYVSRSKAGGISGGLGLADEKAEASIACRQVGPVVFKGALPLQEEVFSEGMNLLFKKLRVVRMVDPKRNTLLYLTYASGLVDGSPKNSVTAVPVSREQKIPVK